MTKQMRLIGISIGGGLIFLGGLTLLVLHLATTKTILTGVRVGPTAIGGQTEAQATEILTEATQSIQAVQFSIDGTPYSLTLTQLGIRLDPETTAHEALTLGSSPNLFKTTWNRLKNLFRPIQLPMVVRLNRSQFEQTLTNVLSKVVIQEHDAQLAFSNGSWQVSPASSGRSLSQSLLSETILHQLGQLQPVIGPLTTTVVEPKLTTEAAQGVLDQANLLTSQPIQLVTDAETTTLDPTQLATWTEIFARTDASGVPSVQLNNAKIQAFVRTLAQRYNQDPVDARVEFTDGTIKITQDSRIGRTLDENQTVARINQVFKDTTNRSITLPFVTKDPDVSSATVASLGLKELIGTATTNFSSSPDNRIHNIVNGAHFLADKLIKPGEEFSVVTSLGSVDQSTGYLPELVIKENHTTPEYGGGLCQVSTTLFRAALDAGLKITERQNHSYRVSYYERGVGPGLDATIYLPRPDLKFLNDTPGWILVQNSVDTTKNNITFELYGTKDGRRSEVSKPVVYDITDPDPPVYAETVDLPKGTVKQIEHAHQGAKTTVTYKVYRDSQLINDQTFQSTYKAWQARYLVGTGDAPAPIPADPTPTTSPSSTPDTSPTPTA